MTLEFLPYVSYYCIARSGETTMRFELRLTEFKTLDWITKFALEDAQYYATLANLPWDPFNCWLITTPFE